MRPDFGVLFGAGHRIVMHGSEGLIRPARTQ